MERCAGAVISAVLFSSVWGCLLAVLFHSFLYMPAAFLEQMIQQEEPPLLTEGSAPTQVIFPEHIQVQLTPEDPFSDPFEFPILRVPCYAHLPKVLKLPYYTVTNSSILQYYKMCMIIIPIQNWWSDLDLCLFKLMLGNTNLYLKDLMAKCELSHQSLALLIYTYQK